MAHPLQNGRAPTPEEVRSPQHPLMPVLAEILCRTKGFRSFHELGWVLHGLTIQDENTLRITFSAHDQEGEV